VDVFRIIPHVVALATAYALAFPIGWNREHEERSAGLRTFPLRLGDFELRDERLQGACPSAEDIRAAAAEHLADEVA
jgi:hypothetical protein